MKERIVITGLGAVSGFGLDAETTWQGLLEGACAIRPIGQFDASSTATPLAAEAPDFSIREFVPKHYRKASKVMARDIDIAVIAAGSAVADAGLKTRVHADEEPSYPTQRLGCQIGAGLIAAEIPELAAAVTHARDGNDIDLSKWGESGMTHLPPLWMLKYLPNMLACHVTILHGCEGPSNTLTCAEASGLLSMGESSRVIERGDADACFAGGAESKVNLMGIMRLERSRRLATHFEGDPSAAMRPFDPDTPGQLLGEMAGILVLEREATATQRGAAPIAVLSGFGAGHSARALDSLGLDGDPPSEDSGLTSAIRRALDDAGLTTDDIDAIVPHAAGHPWLDAAEAGTLREVFGDKLPSIPLVTICPMLGEGVAGMGAMQAVVGALCIRNQTLPARLHAGAPADGLDAGPAEAREMDLRHVLVCTGSTGGSAAAVVLSKP